MTALVDVCSDVWMYFEECTGPSIDVGDELPGVGESDGEDVVKGGGVSSLVRLGMPSSGVGSVRRFHGLDHALSHHAWWHIMLP